MKKINLRAFVSLSLLFWTAALLMNGVVLYIAPPGRDAHWVNWTFWGLSKDQWGALHTIGGFLFVVFALWHIALNWRPMLAYVEAKAGSATSHKAELSLAALVFAAVTAGSALDWPPFRQVMDYGESVKEGWIPAAQKPEVAHGELLRLEDLCSRLGRDYKETMAVVSAAGLKIEEDKTLQYNADRNGLSPAELYEKLFGAKKAGAGVAEGGGYGKKTVKGLSEEFSVPLQTALERLKAAGCETAADSTLRQVAASCGLTPMEAAALIKGS
ncbi:MAG: hypothetical protein A2X35_07590 [Elusimicrobia bacterium GWA2_61_42]|nr:MAG: hypothetical protein A2X35_07590 [Elusimicrobia bacterium GWA2_61_42]OGR77937.1 MAG: hypothetical protein A2X38_10620 [Elusimicrobia bacterium GWC2_61_25]